MIPSHGIDSDPDPLRQRRLSLTFVAFFLFLSYGYNKLTFVEAAAGADAMRDMERSALRTFGEAREFQTLPVRPS